MAFHFCSPQDLVDASRCLACLTPYQLELAKTALLCRIAQSHNVAVSCDVQTLMNQAACFHCISLGELAMIQTQLLCEILNASTGCLLCSDSSDPVADPQCTCALFFRKDNAAMWYWDTITHAWIPLLAGP